MNNSLVNGNEKMKSFLTIEEIYENFLVLDKNEVIVGGWLRSIRNGKQNSFAVLNDGSTMRNLQIFFGSDFAEKDKLMHLGTASSLEISGFLKLTPDREQQFELVAEKILNFSRVGEEYPIQKKNLPIEFIREYPQFRTRTRYFLASFRLRSVVSFLIHKFFQQKGFVFVTTPLISSNDAEGGGESFSVLKKTGKEGEFFNEQARLTVSGQLHEEALTQGLGKVYNFSPCFRAENSNTTKHLAEFWMIEAEMSFCDLSKLMDTIEEMIKYTIKGVLEDSFQEINFFEKMKTGTISKLQSIIQEDFQRVSYSECIEIIKEKIDKDINFFSSKDISWGDDLSSENEKYIASYFGKPVFIKDYPSEIKAFYMKENDDKKTVACVDLLFPFVGEVAGGSSREESYEKLNQRAKLRGLNSNKLDWYLNLRNHGYSPSAGFGMGLERILMFITGIENIRDTIPFPRSSGELHF